MMSENEDVTDIERLGHHEFDLDIEEQQRLQKEGDAEVARVSALCRRTYFLFLLDRSYNIIKRDLSLRM